jgi:membrane-associated phospholipid phosphatase
MPTGVLADARDRVGPAPAAPFLAWPGWPHLLYAWSLSAANGVWFLLVFGGGDLITAHRTLRVPVHFAAELELPFIPAMTAFYMSIYLLFLAGPFVVRTRREFRALILTLAAIIGCAGVGFLLVPAELAFPPVSEAELGAWAGAFHLADRLNLTYSLLPSLHVALAVACVAAFAGHARPGGKVLLWAWAAAIAVSSVLIRQHHVLDVVAGWLLAAVCVRLLLRRMSGGAAS